MEQKLQLKGAGGTNMERTRRINTTFLRLEANETQATDMERIRRINKRTLI